MAGRIKEAIGLGITLGVAGTVLKATTNLKYKPRKKRRKR
jgi:hypothetical protein